MSGGSLNYLYNTQFNDIFDRIKDMETVEKELISDGYTDIAADVRRLIEYCLSAEIRISVLFDNLSDVFYAVEWYISSDYGKDTMLEHFDAYRKGKQSINPNHTQVLKRNICRHGREQEMFIAAEEAAELIQAISKVRRYGYIGEHKDNLIEEIADVSIILQELKMMFDITEADIDKMIDFKINRINKRLNGE